MCERWVSTVRMLRKSCSPISAFVCPRAIRRRTSSSRSLRSSSAGADTAGFDGDARAQRGVEVDPSACGGPDGRDELGAGGLLEDVGASARLQRLARERGVALHGQDHHGARVLDLRDGGQARRPGHVEVEDEDVRVALLDEPQRVRDVAGLTDHVQPLLALEQQAQAGPDDLVVVREDDVDAGVVGIRHASDDSPKILCWCPTVPSTSCSLSTRQGCDGCSRRDARSSPTSTSKASSRTSWRSPRSSPARATRRSATRRRDATSSACRS